MSRISVLHISMSDNDGGSGRSANKIHCGLRKLGFNSRMLVRRKSTDHEDVALISGGMLKLADKAATRVTESLGLQYVYLPSSRALFNHPWYREADIVQLYNTHGNYFSHTVLPRMSREKQIVWRLSDMWPMTGHCAYAGDCERWKTGCGRCPALQAYPRLSWDTSALLWKWKKRVFERSKIHVVAPSNWIGQCASDSPLLGQCDQTLIRNGVDSQLFRPTSQQESRDKLDIIQRGRAVLFVARDVHDPHKGGQLVPRVIRKLWDTGTRDFFLMLVGNSATQWNVDWPCPVWRHDGINDDQCLADVYSAADIVLHPATVENLPNSIVEAMACGRPAVAFDVGGVPEVVAHKQTGFIASAGAADELADGVKWILSDNGRWRKISAQCRQLVKTEYSLDGQAQSFGDLYECLLNKENSKAFRRRSAA